MVNYAFKYDGTFVDRPVAQFLAATVATNTLTPNNVITNHQS